MLTWLVHHSRPRSTGSCEVAGVWAERVVVEFGVARVYAERVVVEFGVARVWAERVVVECGVMMRRHNFNIRQCQS